MIDIGHEPPLTPQEIIQYSPHCPVCDSMPDVFYKNKTGEIIGCELCVDAIEWWEIKPE